MYLWHSTRTSPKGETGCPEKRIPSYSFSSTDAQNMPSLHSVRSIPP